MPSRHSTVVVDVAEVAQELFLMRLQSPDLARTAAPGQFGMVGVPTDGVGPGGGGALFLRRPLAFHGIDGDAGQVSMLFQAHGRGTKALATLQPGTVVDVLGPLGQPISLPPNGARVVFVAGGLGIASLTAAMDAGVSRGWRMTLLAGGRNAWRLYPSHLLPAGVIEITATDDGSAGVRAPVTHLLPQVQANAEWIVACGPTPMLRSLARMRTDGVLTAPVTLLLESRMGCGFGACMGCAVATVDGVRLVCTDGPAFELDNIRWEDPLAPAL
ncbi:MAG: dihydroorotate dehydrogenase electron transfer subunit [Chloroflexi bacterium]|nr:dihydroorotate dehydrogenase electron transfer subunit [Chloroflexota bacterium]